MRSNWRLFAGGLLLPNLLSLVAMTSIVDIGLPPRTSAILLYATVAILARRLPFAIIVVLFLGVLAFDIVHTLSLMFGVATVEFLDAIDRAQRIQFLASPLYVALIVVTCTTTVAALACLRRRAALTGASAPALFVAALGFAAVDFVDNVMPHYYFGATMGGDAPVESAAEVSGFLETAGAGGRNVILVMVESLGYLRDQAARDRVAAPLYDASVTDRYVVTEGHTAYFGSTTSGEMRELCNTRTFYKRHVENDASACLPHRLARRGYSSVAIHGFDGGMFERHLWYPAVGFGRVLFGDELGKATGRQCGGAFRGACDADLAPVIRAAATPGGRGARPRFLYWLTLNTHVPVAPGEASNQFHCADSGAFGRTDVCRMAELWHDVFTVVAGIARDPAVGPADILVVGDHAPPLWSKRGRAQFEPGRVAWYRLRPRIAGTPQMRAGLADAQPAAARPSSAE